MPTEHREDEAVSGLNAMKNCSVSSNSHGDSGLAPFQNHNPLTYHTPAEQARLQDRDIRVGDSPADQPALAFAEMGCFREF